MFLFFSQENRWRGDRSRELNLAREYLRQWALLSRHFCPPHTHFSPLLSGFLLLCIDATTLLTNLIRLSVEFRDSIADIEAIAL